MTTAGRFSSSRVFTVSWQGTKLDPVGAQEVHKIVKFRAVFEFGAHRTLHSLKGALRINSVDIRPLAAFSGTVKDPDTGLEYTEPGMNADCVSGKPISEKQLPERFASPDYQVLLLANKYQTGFDQPLLQAMYVAKRLDGVQAVQTLSRLNRKIPGKEGPFVLDFVNEADDIYKAFKPYYDATSLQESADPQQLETLKHELDRAQVYFWSEGESL